MPPLSPAPPLPYPEAGTVRVGPNEAETIAGNVLAPHSKCDDGGGVPGQEVLGSGFNVVRTISLTHVLTSSATAVSQDTEIYASVKFLQNQPR